MFGKHAHVVFGPRRDLLLYHKIVMSKYVKSNGVVNTSACIKPLSMLKDLGVKAELG